MQKKWDFKLHKFGNKKPAFGCIVAIFCFFVSFCPYANATEIVVNKSVPLTGSSLDDIRAIFSVKKTTWPNHRPIKVYTLDDNHPMHKEFVKNNLRMLNHQLRRIWDRLTFSGTGLGPIELSSEQEMIEKIANTPDSIGYLNSRPDNENIHSFSVE